MTDGERKGSGQARGSAGSRRLALLLLGQLVLLWPFRHYVTDDTYIHLQFARNLAAGSGFSFNPGEPVYGFTSPLWIFVLAAGERLGADPLPFARVAALAFTFASVVAVHRLARVWIRDERIVWAATAVWALDAWLLRWTFSGMDTSLGLFLLAAALAAQARARAEGRSPFAALTFGSLFALARPEGLAFVLLAWLDALLPVGASPGTGDPGLSRGDAGPERRPERRSVARSRGAAARRFIEATMPPLVLVVPWLIYAQTTFGQLLPTSVAAKSVSLAPDLGAFVSTIGRELALLGATRAVELLLLAFAVLSLLGRPGEGSWLRAGRRIVTSPTRLAIVWSAVVLLSLALRDAVLVSRYVLLAVPGLVVVAWAAAERLALGSRGRAEGGLPSATPGTRSRFGSHGIRASTASVPSPPRSAAGARRRIGGLLLLAATSAALGLAVLYLRVLPHARDFPRGLEASVGEIADWLRTESPADAVVAAPDIGLLGYRSERKILDLSGLISPEIQPLLGGQEIEDFISSMGFASVARPDYLIDRATEVGRVSGRGPHGEQLEVVLVREIGPLGLARRATYYSTLYRVDWRDVP